MDPLDVPQTVDNEMTPSGENDFCLPSLYLVICKLTLNLINQSNPQCSLK